MAHVSMLHSIRPHLSSFSTLSFNGWSLAVNLEAAWLARSSRSSCVEK